MAKKKNKCVCPEGVPEWMVTFGDLMALLLVFFVLLLSMSTFDPVKVEEYFDIMRRTMGILEQSDEAIDNSDSKDGKQREINVQNIKKEMDDSKSDLKEAIKALNQAVLASQNSDSTIEQATFEDGKKEFIIDIPAGLLFGEGEYNIDSRKAKYFISKLSRIIRTMPAEINIEVTGHTDSGSFRRRSIPRDNWDLSALRSISVVKEMVKYKVNPAILKVSAHASYRSKGGEPAADRRVELRFYASDVQIDLLQNESFFDRLGGN
jgi:chemotaxis protein MotB